MNCGSLSVGGIGATSNFLEIAAATITVNGPMYVAPTNTATFSSGVLTVGSMAVDPTANNGSGFVVGDGTNAAIYAMYTGDTGYHYFGGGLVVTNGATIEGNGTLVGNVTVLGTFAPGSAGSARSLRAITSRLEIRLYWTTTWAPAAIRLRSTAT